MYHANMLKMYHERENAGMALIGLVNTAVVDVEVGNQVDELESEVIVEPPSESSKDERDYKVGNILSSNKSKQLADLLVEFSDVLSSKPGFTSLGKHDIKLTTDTPIMSKPYPVPFALKQVVIDEVKSMLDLDVIEPSDSQYCSKYVIVKKADNTYRFCIDLDPLTKLWYLIVSPYRIWMLSLSSWPIASTCPK